MTNSNRLYELAKQTIPGGVNSPVRAFGGVVANPFLSKAVMALTWLMQMGRSISIM